MAFVLPGRGTYSVAAAITACARKRSTHFPPRDFQLLARASSPPKITARRFFANSSRRQDAAQAHAPSAAPARTNTLPNKEQERQGEKTKDQFDVNEPERLKAFMRTVPHPVAVITARREFETSGPKAYVGATVSSFNTVSLVPEPIVSFNLLKDSVTLRSIRANTYFVVNLLRNNAQGAKLANLFTKGNDPSPFMQALNDSTHPLKFYSWENDGADSLMPPVVYLADLAENRDHATAFAVLCELKQIIDVGDHAVILGRAVHSSSIPADLWGPSRLDQHSDNYDETNEVCLSYAHGAYSGTRFQSTRPLSWLNRDVHRDIPIKMINEQALDVLAVHYRFITRKVRDGIGHHESGGSEGDNSFTRGLDMNELKDALAYYQARHQEVIKYQKNLRQLRLSNSDLSAATSPLLSRKEKVQFRIKVSMKSKDLLHERTIYQEKITQLEHMQNAEQNKVESENNAPENSEPPQVDVGVQLRHYHRKLQVIQAAMLYKLRSEAVSDAIQDLIPVSTKERALLDKCVRKAFSHLRDDLMRLIRKPSANRKGELDPTSVNQENIESARNARILQTAIILKMMAMLSDGEEAVAARKYLEASNERTAHPGFRKVYVSEAPDEGQEDAMSWVEVEHRKDYEQVY